MRKMKRATAFMLAVLLGVTTSYSDAYAAAWDTTVVENAEMGESVTEETATEESGTEILATEVAGTEEAAAEVTQTETLAEDAEDVDAEGLTEDTEDISVDAEASIQRDAEAETTDDVTEESDTEGVQQLVNYLVVQEPVVTTPGTQTVMTSIGDGSSEVESAILTYKNIETDQEYTVEAMDILDDFVLFQMQYEDESWNGTYELAEITYTIEDETNCVSFAEMGIEAAFGVNQTAEVTPDDVLLSEEEVEALAAQTELNIVSVDENGNTTSETTLEEAMENAGCDVSDTNMTVVHKGAKGADVDSTGMKSVVVVLDPGHGGTDGGASANGIVEKTVNLKIAQYCKAELEEYAGVVVYMTRNDDTYLTLAQRAQVAVDKNADVFISLHNNSNTSSAPNGACVYYPNGNYNSNVSTTGKSLATIIESKLTDLGLASGGIKIRNSENGTKYPDGSLADYYGVIKRCKENGIPGLIVEHAYVSNASDAKNYLSTDEQLKKLGVADATGIAEYFGLSKGFGFSSVQSKSSTTMNLTWPAQSGVTGYEIYRSTSSGDGFSKVTTITSASTTTWQDTGLKEGTTYYYKIRTYTKTSSTTKYGKFSPVASGTTIAAPEISSIKSKSSKELVISWDAVEDATNYEIYRATSQSGTYKLLTTISGINTVNYTDAKVKAGKLYYYKIRSVGQIDGTTVYSGYSDIVSGRTAKVPSGAYVKSKDSTTLRITWEADTNASGYVIKRAESASGKYTKIASVSGGSTTYYDDETVTTNKTYYYKIQAYNHNNGVKGYSGYGKAVSGKTVKKTSITKIVSTSSTKQTITWKKVSGANGYVIYRSTKKNSGYKKIKTISSANTTSYKDSGLKAGTKYYYKVKTRNKVNGKTGYGSYSTVRNGRVGKKAVASAAGSSATKITVSWTAVTDAESYDIYRSTSEKGTYVKVGSAEGSATSYTDSKLKMTKKYYYKVEAKIKGYKATGTSGMSKAVSSYPVRQTSITSAGVNSDGQLQVTWQKITGCKGYELYRSTAAAGQYELLTTTSSSKTVTYVDNAATAGTTYYYKVRPIGKYDGKTIYGKYSTVVSGILLTAPADVKIVSVSENQLDVSWSAVTGATGYVVYRSTELNGTYTEVGATTASQTTFSDITVTAGVTYYYKIKAVDAYNNSSIFSSAASGCAVAKPAIISTTWNADRTGIQVDWKPSPAEVTGYELYRSSYSNPAVQTKVAIVSGTSYFDTNLDASETYYYRVRTYQKLTLGGTSKTVYGTFSDTVSTNSSDYRIMGSAGVTAAQMVKMYQASGKTYPASVYKEKGAADITAFCQIVYEECCIEGVKPEVVFAQICHETAYLQFGGQVKVEQCNFGGLAATDNGASGGTFADVRTGVRTQVQHMKAYASTDPLKQTCIDERFTYVTRGKAEFVQQLGKANWATDTSYDVKLMNYINKIKSY